MDELYEFMQTQIDQKCTSFVRYMYDSLPWDAQMFALIGPRGVGKTTLFLQRIKNEYLNGNADASNPAINSATNENFGSGVNALTPASNFIPATQQRETLYVSLDHVYFANHTIYDTANEFCKYGGKYLFVDEVHNYDNWSRELKNIYDAHPDLHVYFTGSSALNILGGEADLSRRAPIYTMQGLSFREFLELRHGVKVNPFTLDEILAGKAKIPGVTHPLPLFSEYLASGYYPFMQNITSRILVDQIINSTLQFDIPLCANLSLDTGRKLKKLLVAIAENVPYKPNATKLSKKIGVSRNSINEYLTLMERAGMIARLRSEYSGFTDLGKVEKVYLDNPTLMDVLSGKGADTGCMRETFFYNQMRVNNTVVASSVSDFEIDGITFEVGGKHKGKSQIEGLDNAYVVKDDIEKPYLNVIPLWCFGLNY